MQDFQTWRTEIETELAEARRELADAEAALAEARIARDNVAAQRDALHQAVAPIGRNLAGALGARLGRGDEALRQAEMLIAQAAGAANNAAVKVADLADALSQISKLLAPPEPVDEPVEAAE